MQHGAVLILLTIIIICAVAGMVINKSFTRYGDRALYFSEEQIKDAVGNYLDIDYIHGRSTGNKQVHYMYLTTRLREGSDPVYFNTTLLEIVVNGQEGFYQYDATVDCDLNPFEDSSVSSISNAMHTNHYGIKYSIKIEGDDSSIGYITPGDIVVLCAPLAGPLREAEEVRINVVAEGAGRTVLDFHSPELLPGEWIELYEKLI